ncbi:ribonuclease H-like domain-containing protein [Fusibacter tunisiensis]|jgi:uncharacterized protein YprB with RNaseH-like and TPR domain|uniref:Uncharacterized protein YprB with RNaseH-like and TPR domain n=1 Tax=Fusibacter tunisiensis TaxID=1008308 RepID=A0ABS2MQJ2_9FIRM|nr:ribonuclease H-like domain-containing protein [Fusibacter tunisiensis]MBM7561673.1 uncharacterized protein YprB with RNaseH-like and TPR domain [Fusibacter tunisiensis]
MEFFESNITLTEKLLPTSHNFAFIDIETDGLSHNHKLAIIGLFIVSKNFPYGKVIQLFNNDYQSERELLSELMIQIKNYAIDYFISFNGNSFDFPFLNARLAKHKFGFELNKKLNIDLMRIVKKHQAALNLKSATLKGVESYLNIQRNDTISGKDSIILYRAYLETQDQALKKTILLHNYDDILNMYPLVKIFSLIDTEFSNYLYPTHRIKTTKWYMAHYAIDKDFLSYDFASHDYSSLLEHHYEDLNVQYIRKGTRAQLKVSLNYIDSPKLTLFSPKSIYSKEMNSLSISEKQSLIVDYNGVQNYNNIVTTGWQLFEKLYLKLEK